MQAIALQIYNAQHPTMNMTMLRLIATLATDLDYGNIIYL